jgi:hypothetical protein
MLELNKIISVQAAATSTAPRFCASRATQNCNGTSTATPETKYQQHRRNSGSIRYSRLAVGRMTGYSKQQLDYWHYTNVAPQEG